MLRGAPWLMLVSCLCMPSIAGCKTVLWEDSDLWPKAAEELTQAKKIFLGVVVFRENPKDVQEGVRIERILKDSPADAAKLKPGDVIRVLAGQPIGIATELDKALQEQFDAAEIELLVLSGGLERSVKTKLVLYESYYNIAKKRTDAYARANQSRVPAIPFFDYTHSEVPINLWRDYWGEEMTQPVVLYEDNDYLPILNFSAYRIEKIDKLSATRAQYLFPFFGSTVQGTERASKKLLRPGEEKYLKL